MTPATAIRRYIEAVNASDFDALDALMHEDVAHDPSPGPDGSARRFGRAAYREHAAERARRFDERFTDVAVMTNEGERRGAAEFTAKGTDHDRGGRSYSVAAALFVEVEDDRIVRLTEYRAAG